MTRDTDLADRIEAHAQAVACPRHVPSMRGCAYRDGEPCVCRVEVEKSARREGEG